MQALPKVCRSSLIHTVHRSGTVRTERAGGDQFMGNVARRSAVLAGLCAVAVIAGTASVLTGPATPAAASVPGIATYIHLSTKNSDDKTVTINCPKGKKVIDAGGEI